VRKRLRAAVWYEILDDGTELVFPCSFFLLLGTAALPFHSSSLLTSLAMVLLSSFLFPIHVYSRARRGRHDMMFEVKSAIGSVAGILARTST